VLELCFYVSINRSTLDQKVDSRCSAPFEKVLVALERGGGGVGRGFVLTVSFRVTSPQSVESFGAIFAGPSFTLK